VRVFGTSCDWTGAWRGVPGGVDRCGSVWVVGWSERAVRGGFGVVHHPGGRIRVGGYLTCVLARLLSRCVGCDPITVRRGGNQQRRGDRVTVSAEAGQGKADFGHIYDCLDPREYFRVFRAPDIDARLARVPAV
jgi:hypothetical protein